GWTSARAGQPGVAPAAGHGGLSISTRRMAVTSGVVGSCSLTIIAFGEPIRKTLLLTGLLSGGLHDQRGRVIASGQVPRFASSDRLVVSRHAVSPFTDQLGSWR